MMSEIRKQSKEIIIKMMEENPVVIDNHTGKERPITGLVEFVNPDKLLACCFDVKYYSLNPCILDEDNKLHCVEYSIGGDLWSSYPTEEQLGAVVTVVQIWLQPNATTEYWVLTPFTATYPSITEITGSAYTLCSVFSPLTTR